MVKPEQIFVIHPKIRWAGMITRRGKILFAQMRPGIPSLTDKEEDKLLLELRLPLLLEMGERPILWSGLLEFAIISYEKFFELYVAYGSEHLIVVTVDKNIEFQLLSDIANRIKIIQ
jgi:hypothetical protein